MNLDAHDNGTTISTKDLLRLPKQNESSNSNSTINTFVRSSRKRTAVERQQASVVFHPDEALLTFLRARNLYESEAQSKLRRNVLTEFQVVFQNWASSINTNNSNTVVHVCTFGSYRLGVHNASSDIDVLCMVPTHVTRHDFFTSFVQLLQQQQHGTVVTDLQPVPTAFTPVIKLKWKGIPVDLVFANYHTPSSSVVSTTTTNSANKTEPNDSILLLDSSEEEFQILDEHLIGLDEPSVRSLNGVRVAQMLLKLLPQGKMNEFRTVLRTVKEFASVHGVYSNVLGFLGGVNWAIMVVKIIQLFPNEASAAQLIYQFFKTFSQWPWPKPVRIVAPTSPPPGVAPQVVWNPTIYPRDRTHIMPIITPAFPSMNSAYNVGQPQLRRIREELDRTAAIIGRIMSTENMEKGTHSWSEIMEENVFFQRHGHYLQVRILANNAKDFRSWFGFCEARLRILIGNLDSPERGVQAYPFARFFFRKIPRSNDEAFHPPLSDTSTTKENPASTPMLHVSSFFVALRFAPGIESIDLTSSVQETLCKFNSWEDRRQGMDITIEHLLWNQLPDYVFEKNSSTCTSDPGGDDESQTSSREEGSGKRRNTSYTAGGPQPFNK